MESTGSLQGVYKEYMESTWSPQGLVGECQVQHEDVAAGVSRMTWHVCSHTGHHHHSACNPPHEQLLMGLEAGGVLFGVVVVLLFRRGWVA